MATTDTRFKGKKPSGPPKPKKPIAGFAPEDDEGSADEEGGGVFGKGTASAAASKGKEGAKKGGKAVNTKHVNAQLATFNELSKKAAKESADVDPSVYDYDGAWDDMKSVDRKKEKAEEQDAVERRPKYMENILAAADVRKRDQLRAKERLLQREREQEGEEFADKEKFVTSAYKKQQEELLKLEEEERLREEKLRGKSQGMSSFYRNMLDKTESKHDALVAAATSKDLEEPRDPSPPSESVLKEKSDVERARELQAKGASVDINEEGQVVDKSQLLSGGLNLTNVKSSQSNAHSIAAMRRPLGGPSGKGKQQQDMRARQSRMLEEQQLQAQKRALEEETEAKAELERQSKSRKTDKDVMGAKERYLQRKREAAAAAAKK